MTLEHAYTIDDAIGFRLYKLIFVYDRFKSDLIQLFSAFFYSYIVVVSLRCGRRYNRRRVATHDRDDFVSVDLQSRMEANHDVVGEYSSRALQRIKKVSEVYLTFAAGNRAFSHRPAEFRILSGGVLWSPETFRCP